jgi:AcrR family transcriptional regulator
MTASPAPRRLRADAARNRQALVDAARRLLTSRGLSVTLDEIAREAHVNVATAYRRFTNKHELFEAVLREPIDETIAMTERAAAAAAADPEDALRDFLRQTSQLLISHRALSEVVYRPDLNQEADARLEPVLERLLDRVRAAGVIRDDVTTGDLVVIVRMLSDLADIPIADRSSLVDRYLTIFVAGLSPSRAPLPGRPPTVADLARATADRGRP